MQDNLSVSINPITISGSILNGILLAANSNGVIVPHTIRDEEIKSLKKISDINISILHSRYTALGNMILTNDKGALVDPRFNYKEIEELIDTLDVEIVKGFINDLPYVGSLAVATNRGILTHPKIKEDEKNLLEETLKVKSEKGTVNDGVQFPKLGIIVNSKGLLSSYLTTGFELSTITSIFGL
jgi:translation initiation factor 6